MRLAGQAERTVDDVTGRRPGAQLLGQLRLRGHSGSSQFRRVWWFRAGIWSARRSRPWSDSGLSGRGQTTSVVERLLTPSKITAWLDCAHYLTLRHHVDAGDTVAERGPFGALARLLMRQGPGARAAVPRASTGPEGSRSCPCRVVRPGAVRPVGRAGRRPARRRPRRHLPDAVRPRRGARRRRLPGADRAPSTAAFRYEPVDAKLARAEAKPGHVLQLCFYADAIEALTGLVPERVHLWLGSGRMESIRLVDVHAYWRRLRDQLRRRARSGGRAVDASRSRCAHCDFCEFADDCEAQWRERRLAALRRRHPADRAGSPGGRPVATLASLASLDRPVDGVEPERTARLVRQAALQVIAREQRGPAAAVRPPRPAGDRRSADRSARAARTRRRRRLPRLRGPSVLAPDRGLFFLFGLLTDVHGDGWTLRGAVGARPGRGGRADALADRVARRAARQLTRACTCTTTTTPSGRRSSASPPSTVSASRCSPSSWTDGVFVDLLDVVRHAMLVGRRVVRPEERRAARRLRAQPRDRPGRRRGRRVRRLRRPTATRPASTASPATTRTTSGRRSPCATGWSGSAPADLPWRAPLGRARGRPYADVDAQVQRCMPSSLEPASTCSATCSGTGAGSGGRRCARMLAKSAQDLDRPARRPRRRRRRCSLLDTVRRTGKKGQPLQDPALRMSVPAAAAGVAGEEERRLGRLRRRRRCGRLRLDLDAFDETAGELTARVGRAQRRARRRPDGDRPQRLGETRSRSPRRCRHLPAQCSATTPAVPSDRSVALLRRELPARSPPGTDRQAARFTDDLGEHRRVGAAPRPELRRHPGSTRHRQDLHRGAHRPSSCFAAASASASPRSATTRSTTCWPRCSRCAAAPAPSISCTPSVAITLR